MLRLTVGTKFAGVMLLAILLVLLAGATGIAELRQLDQLAVRLAANAEAGEYAHTLQLELRDLRALLGEGIDRKNVEWFHQPVEQPLRTIDTNAANLAHVLSEQGNASRASTIETLRGQLKREVGNIITFAIQGDWNTAYLSLANQVEPIETAFTDLVRAIDNELHEDIVTATVTVRAAQRHALWNLGLTTSGALLVLGLAGWLFWRNLVIPVRHLTHAVEALTQGDMDVRVPVSKRADELGALANAFNVMSQSIREARAALEGQNRRLEVTIRERTAALERSLAAETALRASEAELGRERTFLTSIVDNIPLMIFVKEAQELRFVRMNKAGEELTGYSSAELIGKTDYDIFPDQEAHFFVAKDREVLEQGELLAIPEEVIQTRQKGIKTLHAKKIPIRDEQGRPQYLLGISEDITDRVRAEHEHRMLERKLLETQKLESLGVLAGGIAHDFNNLLVAILGNAGLALLDLAPEAPARSSIMQIEHAAQRAADLTRQMLAYAGKGRFVVEPINLNAAVEEMTHLLQASIPKNVVLRYHLMSQLPTVEADATQIRQVFMNLVINAAEAIGTPSGVITITTDVMWADRNYLTETYLAPDLPEQDYVYVEVSDTGCGMDSATRAKIFEPFYSTKFTGRGLGLAAVLGIVRGHQGALKVYSEPGRGSTFKFLLPSTSHAAPSQAAEEQMSSAWQPMGTVLVVDDEEEVRAVAARMLERFGFSVLTAADGRAGVELFRSHAAEIVCVLLDMTMPQLDGEAAFRMIRQIKSGVQVILMSGYNEQDATSRFVGKGLAGFLHKPFRPNDLHAKLQQILDEPGAALKFP